jgi:hypothetical protein
VLITPLVGLLPTLRVTLVGENVPFDFRNSETWRPFRSPTSVMLPFVAVQQFVGVPEQAGPYAVV